KIASIQKCNETFLEQLDIGEAQTIMLAKEIKADNTLIDEQLFWFPHSVWESILSLEFCHTVPKLCLGTHTDKLCLMFSNID
ncbi:MAG: hypothetical protein GQ569_07740, partial [Methylococcaceae bacterium]|nr:hypothetical protein [Methylococcaceae bacterium]